MNSTELSVEFLAAIDFVNHFFGSLSFFNLSVCLLILIDTDPRGKSYRKYLFSLQFFSTFADLFLSAYSLIVQINCPLIFSNSALSNIIDALTGSIIYITLMGQIAMSYLFCVYFRRK
ncbi:hypothetical protein PENTCL1PPCAC_24914, partial [Pristionchus entomophagus]